MRVCTLTQGAVFVGLIHTQGVFAVSILWISFYFITYQPRRGPKPLPLPTGLGNLKGFPQLTAGKESMMNERKKFYVTTAIPYTSSKPHIGNTYELVLTDSIARYRRMCGYDVFFLTGTDEHGLKIEQAAQKQGVSPKEYVDRVTGDLQRISEKMDISYDKFIRTTDEYHRKAVQKIFNRLYDQGDIYKGVYEGLYCTPCESFWTETQAPDGKCPDCGRPVQKSKEEAYFLKLSKYQHRLEEYLETHPDFIVPEARKKEMVNNFIQPGVQDLCVSRSSFTWGVPVEFDPGHIIYVWIDALTNYITALGYAVDEKGELYEKYWPADLQVIGKDILRFHTIYWPVILMALGEPLPKQIFGHPWLLEGNDKMSKSVGNVIYADELADKLGTDAVRYYVLAEMPYLQDGSITYELLLSKYNADLANTLGNLVNRTVAMINQYCAGTIPQRPETADSTDVALKSVLESCAATTKDCMESCHLADACDAIMTALRRLNKYIDETQPWVLGRDGGDKERLSAVLYHLVEGIRICAILLAPIMPGASVRIFGELNHPENVEKIDGASYDQALTFGKAVPVGARVNPAPTPLFARINEKEFFREYGLEPDKRDSKKTDKQGAKQAKKQVKEGIKAEKKADDVSGVISIDEFAKVKLIAARVTHCEPVPDSDKLLQLQLDDGMGGRQVVSGIAKSYTPQQLIGKKLVLVSNLKKARIRGVESEGMILAAGSAEGENPLHVVFLDDAIQEGTEIR